MGRVKRRFLRGLSRIGLPGASRSSGKALAFYRLSQPVANKFLLAAKSFRFRGLSESGSGKVA
jgi:hypothetical protein